MTISVATEVSVTMASFSITISSGLSWSTGEDVLLLVNKSNEGRVTGGEWKAGFSLQHTNEALGLNAAPRPLQWPPRSSLMKSLSTSQLKPNMQYPAPFLHVRI